LHGLGPFVLDTENQSLIILQTRTAVLAITALALAAGMAERRRAEAAIEHQRAEVEAANRAKDNFLAMLSHELRTPLTPVLATLEALKTGPPLSSEIKTALAMMQRNIELESQLIDDLLDLTRISTNKLQLHLQSMDAHRAIWAVANVWGGNTRQESPVLSRPAGDGLPYLCGCAQVSANHVEFIKKCHQVHREKWQDHHLVVELIAAKFDHRSHRYRDRD
jgi:signal transduction histidine kinase